MRLAFLFVLLFACPAWAQPAPGLLSQLRQGGYVLYLRHTSTDRGRDEARAIGEHVKRLKIPIGEVLASPFCRTLETARLAFGKARATGDVRGGPAEASRYEALKKLLSSPVPKGANRVISSHGNPFYALAGSPYLAEGEMAVVKPDGERFSVIARLPLDAWPRFE